MRQQINHSLNQSLDQSPPFPTIPTKQRHQARKCVCASVPFALRCPYLLGGVGADEDVGRVGVAVREARGEDLTVPPFDHRGAGWGGVVDDGRNE